MNNKKSYSTPTVVNLGKIVKLTKGGNSAGGDMNAQYPSDKQIVGW